MRQFVLTIAAAVLCAGTAIAQSGRLPQPTSPNNSVQQQAVEQNLKDVRFAFDSYELSDEARKTLQANADWLKAHPDAMGKRTQVKKFVRPGC